MTQAALSIEALEAAVRRIADGGITPARRAALERLKRTGLPTTRDEDWKYTDLAPIIDISNRWFAAADPAENAVPTIADSLASRIDASWFVIANGSVAPDAAKNAELAGIKLTQIDEIAAPAPTGAALSDLNAVLLQNGLQIAVPVDARLTKPLGFLCIDEATGTPGLSQVRIELDVAPGAVCEVLEYHVSTGDAPHFSNTVIDLRLGDGARAAFVRLQNRAHGHMLTARLQVEQGRDSIFEHAAFDLGGSLTRSDLHVNLAGPGASTELSGLYLAGAHQHIDNHIRVDHRIGPAVSRQEYRGILAADARCVWNGKAIVHVGADGTDAEQANHNLLLSTGAEIDAKPELEIYADEVKCSHGATVGELDEQALFYLRTRGIERDDATRILTRAFGNSIISKLPIEALRDIITETVDARLSVLIEDGNQ